MSKPVKYSIAVVLKSAQDPNQFLVVKRPDNDPELAGNWGFPAGSSEAGETPDMVARRVCHERLGCTATSTRLLGMMFQKRNSYDIFLMDIEMLLDEGQVADVAKANTTHTAYTEQRWSTNPLDLMPAAHHGSCCASIFLTDRGLLDREEWIASLEGSDIVG
jgi:8-oxo-dGTP pyrophosphatase MutT (NUDIX family)